MRFAPLLAIALACSSCSVIEQPSGLIARWSTEWRDVATESDRERLMNWRSSFVAALTAAKAAGHSAEIAREGSLLEPDSALPNPAVRTGIYRCRVIKLGAKTAENLPFVELPPAPCRVKPERDLTRMSKLGGSQRYLGLIFPGDAVRQVFLGTLVLQDERRALQYGQDEQRDVAGYVERIGPNRWRLIMPQPHFESQFDVMELVPSTTP
ncbi:MAG TPA: DUF4893 domain-containing protein [Sphingomicrobium sp.]|nr:DUF4893 domain-containing protein [Sphingomicrobium sp.]